MDTSGLTVPLADNILPRDPSDAGTFALAGLLAPVVVLAIDHDITDPGLATQSYRVLVENAGVITVASQGAWSGLIATTLVVGGIKGLGRGLARAAAPSAGPPIFIGLLLAAIATSSYWLPALRNGAPRAWQGVCSLAEQAAPRIEELVRQYQSATAAWDDAAFEGTSSSRRQAVARRLAAAPTPMIRGSIADALYPAATAHKRRETMAELAVLLREVPAFVSVGTSRWTLGRRGVDFGGVVDGEERLLSPGIPKLLLGPGTPRVQPPRHE